jgi:hypothetical protein
MFEEGGRMKGLLSWSLLAPALLVLAAAGRADDAKPKEVPVEARLVAKKATYTLDLGGKTAKEFQKLIADAEDTGRYPPPPAVELVLELRNTSAKDVQIWVSGDPTQVLLDLKGPGAVNVAAKMAFTLEFRVPKAMTLAPGKSHTIAIPKLQYGFRGLANLSYWTAPGEYTLTASFQTAIAPAPPGVKPEPDGFGKVTLTSAPVKIKVEAK